MDPMHERMRQRIEQNVRRWETIAAHGRAQIEEMETLCPSNPVTASEHEDQVENRRRACVEQESFAQDGRELLAMLDTDVVPLEARHLAALL
ncbi:hypothetical protein [Baekduia sp. Peel2402]|uniref:hypothetical protein n=1 Tax=Baekduia sp. Peel2402 TaxID=3458296 RepID=UPI00403E458D